MRGFPECADFRCRGGNDREIIERQLGRLPEGMAGVAARCTFGAPAAISCSPVIIRQDGRAEPFPTIYWLTCPHLREAVGRMEGSQAFDRIRAMINENAAFCSSVESFAREYAALRESMHESLPDELKNAISRKATSDLLRSGPGGVKDAKNLKCLHIHMADWISGMDDPIGGLVAILLGEGAGDPATK